MRFDLLSGALLCPLCRSSWCGLNGCCRECWRRLADGGSGLELAYPGLVALGHYRGELARAVRSYKFGGARRLARTFADALVPRIAERSWRPQLVTYVPLHARRRRQRGFDQAGKLAEAVALRLRLPVVPLLTRSRNTPQQARLTALERRRNLEWAFRAKRCVSGDVLLIDDVFTTGTTLGTCRSVLESAGARTVYLAVLAVAPRHSQPFDSQ